MIEFKCQHCGKGLHLNDSYAGRDGWCRVCKRMVIVPGGGPVARVEELPPEEGYERLQRLLQYAATKADKFKVHLAREAKEKEHTVQIEGALEQALRDLKDRETDLERLNGEFVSLAAVLREKEARLAELSANSAAPPTPEAELELVELRAEIALEREARMSLSRALEGAVATLKSQLAQAESERDRLAEILEEGSAGEKDSTLQLMQKDRDIVALNAALDDLTSQQEESNRSTRDQIASLEAQVLLFNEIKERMAGLQGRIKELEQERLDTSLALDGAQQSEVLQQKKIGALEVSLKQALAEQSERAIQSDHYQRELAVRDEQVRKLGEELQALTEGLGRAVLEAEKSTRTAQSAESRSIRLAAELGDLQGVRDQLAAENDLLKKSTVELEARVVSLNGSLETARADAAEKASHEPAVAALQAELSTARRAHQRSDEDGAAERASLLHTVAELQAEIMNLTEALQREVERTESAQAQLASLPPAEAETARQAELESALERASALEAQLEAGDELASRHQAESEERTRALSEALERIVTLESALAASGADSGNTDEARADDSGEDNVSFILLSPEPGATVVPPIALDERQRQLEKKQMMDVLSEFLNK